MKPRFDKSELKLLYLPERYPPEESIKKIVFPADKNSLTEFDLDLTPYLRTPLALKGDSRIQWIYLIAPTQSGKTAFLLGVVADCILQDPGMMKYCLPDEKTAQHVWDDRIVPMLTNSPELKKHLVSHAKRKIRLDNMDILPAWSNSPGTVSGTPCKYVIADEIRLFKLEIKGEANALKQLHDRMTIARSMGTAQGFGCSSGGQHGDLLHQLTIGEDVSNLYWHLKCKHCKTYFKPDFFRDLKDYDTLKCPVCKKFLDDSGMKRLLNKDGCYALEGFEGSTVAYDINEAIKDKMVFHYCSISSPFRAFLEIKNEYVATKNKLFDYKNFIMCWLAQFWQEDASACSKDKLIEVRARSNYIKGEVPEDCSFITAGVDSQAYGFNITVVAWSMTGVYILDYFVIKSPHLESNSAEVTNLFDNHINNRVYASRNGKKWKIALWGIDTNSFRSRETREATDYFVNVVRTMTGMYRNTVALRYNPKTNVYIYSTDYYQTEIDITLSKDNFHLPVNASDDFVDQLTSVRKILAMDKKHGVEKFFWKKTGQSDYRSGLLEATVCLDIHFENGDMTLRSHLNDPSFVYNPYDYEMAKISKTDDKYMNDGTDNNRLKNYYTEEEHF